ncbi:MAG TPA: DoxX family protein [Thermoplasmata archaeon]|nr:DoxX family protein [Thermoplasmata archaeon]
MSVVEAFPTAHVRKRWFEYVFGTEWKRGSTWSIFLARLALGFVFLWGGYQKLLTEWSGGMATKGFLSGTSVASGPFAGVFNSFAGNWTVEYLVVYGELLIGVAFLFGVLTRVGAIAGMLQMTLFTIAMWPIQDAPSANPILDTRTFYLVIFVMMFFLVPGRFLGGDGILRKSGFVQKRPRLLKALSWLG